MKNSNKEIPYILKFFYKNGNIVEQYCKIKYSLENQFVFYRTMYDHYVDKIEFYHIDRKTLKLRKITTLLLNKIYHKEYREQEKESILKYNFKKTDPLL